MFTIPNIETNPTFDGQSVVDATDIATITAGSNDGGVVSGCAVTAQSAPNMTVQVASGTVINNGTTHAVSAVSSATIAAASASDRKDIVVADYTTGAVSAVTGTACGTVAWTRTSTGLPPVKPAIPANCVLLAEIYVASTTTSIVAGNIIDKTLQVVTPTSSVFGRTGAVVATTGDYTAAQVTNAADKSSASDQSFTGNLVTAGNLIATGTLKFNGVQITGTASAGQILRASSSSTAAWASELLRITHTWNISGAPVVTTADENPYPGFMIYVPTGQTVTLHSVTAVAPGESVQPTYKLRRYTSAAWGDITGFGTTGSPLSAVTIGTSPTAPGDVSLVDGDVLGLWVVGAGTGPTGLRVTVALDYGLA